MTILWDYINISLHIKTVNTPDWQRKSYIETSRAQ